jgi:hypothetical protein
MASANRRTTLTLPVSVLENAEKIAREKHVTLSTVVNEALADGLAIRSLERRAEEILTAYQAAFRGFSEEEQLLLDGVDLEPAAG